MNPKSIIIYTDGGARGNPGPAAIGVTIHGKRYNEYIGETTNNVAEYRAVIFALKKALGTLGVTKARATSLHINTDSELIAKQLMKLYRVKQPHLKPLWLDAQNLMQSFAAVQFIMIPREENKEADALVNEALDNHAMRGI